jgi:hypothetical protein
LFVDLVEGSAEASHGRSDGLGVMVAGVGVDGGDGEVLVMGVEAAGGVPVLSGFGWVAVGKFLGERDMEGDTEATAAFLMTAQPLVRRAVC